MTTRAPAVLTIRWNEIIIVCNTFHLLLYFLWWSMKDTYEKKKTKIEGSTFWLAIRNLFSFICSRLFVLVYLFLFICKTWSCGTTEKSCWLGSWGEGVSINNASYLYRYRLCQWLFSQKYQQSINQLIITAINAH